MRALKTSLLVLAAVLAAAQMVRPERVNRPEDPARTMEAQLRVPVGVAASLRRACGDCHSNRTRWPWYSHVAPSSWFVADHVNHGRRHLNLSEWLPTAHGPKDPVAAICREVRAGAMPLRSYLWLHPEARLSAGEVRAICAWAEAASHSARSATAASTR